MSAATSIRYSKDATITVEAFIDILERSTLSERRPVEDRDCVRGMLESADLLVTAWQADRLVGVARSVTDFHYCCYLSDLAVDVALQRGGVGRELLRHTRAALGPKTKLILLAAPAAAEYYPHIGFERHESAWLLHEDQAIR